MIEKIGVIGAGQMGSGIAHVFALNGFGVKLADIGQQQLERALEVINRSLDRQASRGAITAQEKDAALERIETGTDFSMF
ncbi:MAG: 3-hydroxyacyl-CoA dehydrogenase NAD-binding domain-containing protein, partial [Alphaproteobacteria bacterium]